MNKHLRNLSYILRHKWHVFKMGLKYRVWWHQLVLHDWTKFTPKEWWGYANHFYDRQRVQNEITNLLGQSVPTIEAEIEIALRESRLTEYRDAFNDAWNHHQKANKHHWQYWVLRNDDGEVITLKMPDRFLREMVADWAGASLAIKGFDDTVNWYGKNREIMLLHPETRKRVEELIGYYRQEDGVLPKAG